MIFKFNDYKLNEASSEYLSITDAAVNVLKEQDKPLSISEIWLEIRKKNLVSPGDINVIEGAVKYGKVVGVKSGYLDTILSRASINTKRTDKNNKNLFIVLDNNPQKFIYNDGSFVEKSIEKSTNTKKYTFVEAAQLILKQNDNKPMTALEIWEEVNTQNLVETIGKTPKASMNAQLIVYSDNTTAIGKKKNSIFRIIEDRPYKFILLNPELEIQSIPDEDVILPPSEFIQKVEKPKDYLKNPFGCKDEDGKETSTLCIIGKSGSGKTTSTEIALEEMKHEYLLYIPIEGEYTFSQYTGKDFEMSSLGEFMMMAQNDPGKCYTIIFDECHRPITISKLNTDLLQALSSRRNRGGERFVTMDRSTKRMYTSSTDEFPINLKTVSGKVLVPDNFGIVCLSSNPSVICRNDDFLNRVDLVVFHESDRDITDLTKLKKLEPSEKNIESIRGLLLSDGKQ